MGKEKLGWEGKMEAVVGIHHYSTRPFQGSTTQGVAKEGKCVCLFAGEKGEGTVADCNWKSEGVCKILEPEELEWHLTHTLFPV